MRAVSSLLVAFAVWLAASPGATIAQPAYPTRPVKVIVPSAAGGGIDIVGRVLAENLSRATGQQFYVENRSGAGNMIGMEAVAKAEPDGYTLLVAGSPLTINHLTYKNIGYDAVRDFSAITQVVSVPSVLVVDPRLPIKSMAEFLAETKRQPGHLTYGSAGLGTNPHMAMELLKSIAGIEVRHVAYRGVGPALVDVIGGNIACMIAPLISAKSQVDAGSVRVLAVTGRTRAPSLPAVPTIDEAGVAGYETLQWYGLLAPAGTPAAIVSKLHGHVVAALATPEVRRHLEVEGGVPVGSTPAEFAAFIKADMAKWGELAKVAKLQPGN